MRVLIVAALGATLVVVSLQASPHAQYRSTSSDPRHILEGHWQSCQDPPGGPYTERVYDHVVNGVGQFEVHLGPRREFAIFKGVVDEHRAHESPDNLLKPFRVTLEGTRGSRRWEVPSLNVAFTVTMGGGSRLDCENWFILLERIGAPSE